MRTPFHPAFLRTFAVMGRAFRYRNYRLFFAGQVVSLIGSWIAMTATSWLAWRLTGSAFILGVVGFAGQLPTLLLAPVAGQISDRHSRHRILLVTQALCMAQTLTLAALIFAGWISIPWLIGLSVFQALVNAFDLSARQAFSADLIEKREDLANAIALNSSVFNGARLVGPAVGGILIAAAGEGVCFLIDGISYLASLGALAAMRISGPGGRRASGTGHFREGWRYAMDSTPIRSLIMLVAWMSLVGSPYMVLMPMVAATVLGGGPHTLGFLMSSAGVGALCGALWLATRRSVLGLGRVITLAAAAFGLGLLGFAWSNSLWTAVPCLVAAGGGLMIQMASSNTILQTIVDDDKRGRVMSLFVMAFMGAAPIGSLLAGSLSERYGAAVTLALCGVCCLGGSLWFHRRLPALREAVRPIYTRLGIIPEVAAGIDTAATLPPEE